MSDSPDTLAFDNDLSKRLNGEVFLANSGKAALYLILRAARRAIPGKSEVIIPDYTCWSVPSAVVRAGLKVRPVDIEAENFGLSPPKVSATINEKTLAVIVTHLFGIPARIDAIEKICSERNVLLIDDAAQGLGASLRQRPLGSFGDAGILSFGRGKNITTISGGALVIRENSILERINEIFQSEFLDDGGGGLLDMIRLTTYKVMFNRMLYWIPDRLPYVRLGETIYNPNFKIGGLSQNRARRGAIMIRNLAKISRNRNQKASELQALLADVCGSRFPVSPTGGEPQYLRLPMLLSDKRIRRYILRAGHKLGISAMYPGTVSSIEVLEPHLVKESFQCPVAKEVSDTLVTLPTHHDIEKQDILRIADFVKKAVARD